MLAQLQQAIELPESDFKLFKLIQDHETKLHTFNLKLSPDKTTSTWLAKAKQNFGDTESILRVYEERLTFLNSLL